MVPPPPSFPKATPLLWRNSFGWSESWSIDRGASKTPDIYKYNVMKDEKGNEDWEKWSKKVTTNMTYKQGFQANID